MRRKTTSLLLAASCLALILAGAPATAQDATPQSTATASEAARQRTGDGTAQDRNPLAEDISVHADVDSTQYLIGEWIVLSLEIEAPATWTINPPVTDEDIVNGEFVAAEDPDRNIEGERQRLQQEITVTVFDTGSVTLGTIVRYRVPGDTSTYTAVSNSIDLRVTTVELDTTQSFRDIKDVMDVSLTIWDYLMIAGIILLVALLLWFGWRWYRSRRDREETVEEPPVPELPPAVMALSDLDALRAQRLWQEGRHKEYQSRLTDILRTYVERRYDVPAMEHPTSEIMPDVAMLGLPSDTLERFERVLLTADRTKFARYTPTAKEHESGMQFAVEFVESTRDDADV